MDFLVHLLEEYEIHSAGTDWQYFLLERVFHVSGHNTVLQGHMIRRVLTSWTLYTYTFLPLSLAL